MLRNDAAHPRNKRKPKCMVKRGRFLYGVHSSAIMNIDDIWLDHCILGGNDEWIHRVNDIGRVASGSVGEWSCGYREWVYTYLIRWPVGFFGPG